MYPDESFDGRLARIRQGRRTRRDTTVALGDFLPAQFEREHAEPIRDLGDLIDLWETAIPQSLIERTRLTAYRSGTLHVSVDSSATLFEVDRLLRSGIEAEMRQASRKRRLRRVRLTVDSEVGPGENIR